MTKFVVFCTDVAARGLDIPEVDWIVQYDPPEDAKTYIHRVGRTARGVNTEGKALLVLRADELIFLQYLKQAKVPVQEFEFSWNKIKNVQTQLQELVKKNHFLNVRARDSFKSYRKKARSAPNNTTHFLDKSLHFFELFVSPCSRVRRPPATRLLR